MYFTLLCLNQLCINAFDGNLRTQSITYVSHIVVKMEQAVMWAYELLISQIKPIYKTSTIYTSKLLLAS